MKALRRLIGIIARGLALMLPLLVTIWVLIWLGTRTENVLGKPLEALAKDTPFVYVPGMGVLLMLVLAAVLGTLAGNWLLMKSVALFESYLARLPLIRTVYGSIRDLMDFMGGKKKGFSRVVLVKMPGTNFKMIGLVTQESLAGIAGLEGHVDRVVVYVSQSYNIGGQTLLVLREDIEEINMKVEDALRFSLTAGISAEEAGVLRR